MLAAGLAAFFHILRRIVGRIIHEINKVGERNLRVDDQATVVGVMHHHIGAAGVAVGGLEHFPILIACDLHLKVLPFDQT